MKCASAAAATALPPCASVSARASRRSSNGSTTERADPLIESRKAKRYRKPVPRSSVSASERNSLLRPAHCFCSAIAHAMKRPQKILAALAVVLVIAAIVLVQTFNVLGQKSRSGAARAAKSPRQERQFQQSGGSLARPARLCR